MKDYKELYLKKGDEEVSLKEEIKFLVKLIEDNTPLLWLHNADYEKYKKIREKFQ